MSFFDELKVLIAKYESGPAPTPVSSEPPFLYPASPRFGSKNEQKDIGPCNPLDLPEVKARLAEGYTYAGNRAKWGEGLDKADAELRRLWSMSTPEYQTSRYRRCDPTFACAGIKGGLIEMPGANPMSPQNLDQYEGFTLESFLANVQTGGGPSGG